MSPAPYTVTKPLRLGSEPWSARTAFLPACEASMAAPIPEGKEMRTAEGKGGEESKGEERKERKEEGREERTFFP